LILANPPYVRHHHLSKDDKERLQRLTLKLTGVEVNGLAGLYVYFLLLATSWMEDNGYAAWLIPLPDRVYPMIMSIRLKAKSRG
jgi:methylase of polypeptide subunit release factors